MDHDIHNQNAVSLKRASLTKAWDAWNARQDQGTGYWKRTNQRQRGAGSPVGQRVGRGDGASHATGAGAVAGSAHAARLPPCPVLFQLPRLHLQPGRYARKCAHQTPEPCRSPGSDATLRTAGRVHRGIPAFYPSEVVLHTLRFSISKPQFAKESVQNDMHCNIHSTKVTHCNIQCVQPTGSQMKSASFPGHMYTSCPGKQP